MIEKSILRHGRDKIHKDDHRSIPLRHIFNIMGNSRSGYMIYRRNIDTDQYESEPVKDFGYDVDEKQALAEVKHWFYRFANGGMDNCKALYLYWGRWRYAKIMMTDDKTCTIDFRNQDIKTLFESTKETIPTENWGHQTTLLKHKWIEINDSSVYWYQIVMKRRN